MNAHAASGRRWKPAPLDEAGSATVPRRQGYHGSPSAQACRTSSCRALLLVRGLGAVTPSGRGPQPPLVHALDTLVDPVGVGRDQLPDRSRGHAAAAGEPCHQAGEVPWRVELHHPNEDIKG